MASSAARWGLVCALHIRRELIQILASIPSSRFIATHDLALIAELCPRALLLDAGQLVASGPSKNCFAMIG